MKFVCTDAYREYRGHVFANGKPATVTDSATIEALMTMPEFSVVEDQAAPAEALLAQHLPGTRRPTLHARKKT